MSEPEEIRNEPFLVGAWPPEPARAGLAPNAEDRPRPDRELSSRAVGAPLPTGRSSPDAALRAAPAQGRSLPGPKDDDHSLQRMVGTAMKQALPFVQKLLPLIDGNVATVVASLFTSRPSSPVPPPPVDLTPVHSQMTELQVQHQELQTQVLEQTNSLKKMADQLEMVREATDRNTLEQQELIEDLKAVGNKVNLFALLLIVMLLVSLIINLVLFLHIKQVLP